MNNPLCDFQDLPRFAHIQAAHVTPAIEHLLAQARACIERVATDTDAPTWDNFIAPQTDVHEQLQRAWGVVGHLNAVVNNPQWREAYNENLGKITAYYTEISQDLRLYARTRALHTSTDFATLTPAQQSQIEHELRDFRLGGAELNPTDKARFAEIQAQLAQLSAKFEENLLDTMNDWVLWLDDASQLDGVPADVVAMFAQAAAEEGREQTWRISLHAPSYLPILQYANHRPLRETLYRAYATRASEFGKSEWDNGQLIPQILALRQEEAHLLGFENFAQQSLAAKMANTPAEVLHFLRDLAQRAKPFAQQDMAELTTFATTQLGFTQVEPWDIAYISEKLRLARYAFSDHEVKQYFTEPQVLQGLFSVIEQLFGLQVRAVPDAETWHPDAHLFALHNADGQLIGQFYLDLYARQHKRGGAWMDDVRGRRRSANGSLQTPVAYLICNFAAPVGDKPALFTHDEVITLFHECGHGLHHLLTTIDTLGVAGINGVEWDAVELPSQLMENFCWEWDVVSNMARHVVHGSTLPRELFDKMLAAKNFQSGMQTVRQIEFALFDMLLHTDFSPQDDWRTLAQAVRAEVAVIFPPDWHRFPTSFSHIFAGGYAAGYYSYKWAEVLSADAYAAFEEQGGLNRAVGLRLWQEVLAVGSSRPAMASFIAFRGREPRLDALLRHNGMLTDQPTA